MPIYEFENVSPELPDNDRYFVAPGAHVIGKVRMGADSSVWFNAVVRGDTDLIDIGPRRKRAGWLRPAHRPRLPARHRPERDDRPQRHPAWLRGREGALIGMGATILNGAKIGKNCLVGANALVTEGKEFPDNH